jgi:PAS domain S-box-containing protein
VTNPGAAGEESSSEEVLALVRQLHQTQSRLEELTSGEVDAVAHPGGQYYLLNDAQEKLRLSEERFQGMYAAAAIGIAISTLDGRYLQANAAYCRMLGYTEEELTQLNFVALTHPEDIALNRKVRDELLSGLRESFVLEKRYLKKGGDIIWARVSVSATHAKGGEMDTLIVMAEDVSEVKKSQDALMLFRTLIDRSPDAIEVLDPPTGRFLDVNETGCQRLGYSRKELLSMNVSALAPEEHPLSWPSALATLKQKGFVTAESRHRRKDGSTYPVEIYSRYIDLNEGYVVAVVRDVTERKKTEARFRLLVDSNAQGVFFWNSKGEIREANDAFLNLVGYSREEMDAGSVNWMELTPLEYTSLDASAFHQLAASGVCKPYEKEFIRRDGSRVPVLIGAACFSDSPSEGVCFALDLSEQKRAESEIRFNEQRFRLLVEATTAIAWDTPASGEFIVDQPSWTEFTGQSFEELHGWGWLNAVHPDDRKHTKAAWSEAVADGVAYEVEHRLLAKNHAYHNMMVRAVPIMDAHGAIRQWVGIHTDITERKKYEERIFEQAALLDKASDAIMVRDLEGKLLFWNKGAERIYGWTSEKVLGRNTSEFLYANPEKFEAANAKTINQGEWQGEHQQLGMAGNEITIQARWTLIRDKEGAPKSVLAINTDITERKKIEQQFLRAQRMESIGTLAGGVAHDLNNILAPILMSIEVLKLSAADEETSAILHTIETSAKRGANVVRQVLSFARGLESEMIEVQPKPLLDEVENIIRETFPKNIQPNFSIPKDAWTIEGDPTQIHQVLLNLCLNARDAMPNGGNLSVAVTNCVLDENYSAMNLQAKAGRYLMIDVTDSGVGMPQGTIDKIFEPFFTTKDLSKGTGLGLSTVMAIVKSHQGIINVYSEVGRGSTFKVYLPAMVFTALPQSASGEKLLKRGAGQTILVIDDEAAILTITTKTLRSFGYNVITSIDGAEAVALYAQHKNEVAAVLTDMTMPIMNGVATIRALMRINPDIKVVAASGLTASGDDEKLRAMGVSHFLVKPYTAYSLLQVLDELLTHPKA